MNTDIQFLKELQIELKTQENDCQAAPRFWVIMDYEFIVTEKGYHDRVSIYDANTSDSCDIVSYVKSILEEEDDDRGFPSEIISELKDIIESKEYPDEDQLIEWIEENCLNVSVIYEKEVDVIKRDTLFLTKKEAKDHLRLNSHHYTNKAHTYAMTAWRAPTVERLLNILEKFDWDSIKINEP